MIGFLIVLLIAAFAAPARAQLQAQIYATGFALPVGFVQDPTDASTQLVLQQRGRIRVVRNGVVQATDFLDLSASVSATGAERGLLGLAFAPDYATSRRFFVNFTNTNGNTVVARFKRSATNSLVADASSRFDLRWGGSSGQRFITQPYSNHNGGNLVFGPDGYLYIGLGDGGAGDDPEHRAQNPNTLLGKMLRIDVNVPDSDSEGYVVPASNPFLDGLPVAALPEIWAFGLRNPWRYSFDDPARGGTGALIIADVGQESYEEIDYEPPNSGGRNYGWRNREGMHDNVVDLPPAYLPLIEPVYEYLSNGAAVTGGFLYRGSGLPAAYRGRYFYGDYVRGRVWSLVLDTDPATGEATAAEDVIEHTTELGGTATLGNVSSFGIDSQGELYILNYSAGRILKIVSPTTLTINRTGSGTGAVTSAPAGISCGSDCVEAFSGGTAVVLTPVASTGSAFAGWSGDADCLDGRVTVSAALTCTARFDAVGATASIRLVDLSGDGSGDVFLYTPTTGAWRMAFSDRLGGFNFVHSSWSPEWTVTPLHLNTDTLIDFFLYKAATGAWFQARSTGSGDFTYTSGTFSPGWRVYAARLDADSIEDVFLYDPGMGAAFQCFVDGAGNFSAFFRESWAPNWEVFPALLNADPLTDIFLYNRTTGQWFRALTSGAGGFTYITESWLPGWSVTIADFTGDGLDDVFLYAEASGQWFQCLNTGTTFTYHTEAWSTGWRIARGRLDGDGRDDLFLYNPITGRWFQCFADGAGGFSRYISEVWSANWQVALTDLNADGFTDVFLYNATTGQYFQCLTGAAGNFATYVTATTDAGLTVIAQR